MTAPHGLHRLVLLAGFACACAGESPAVLPPTGQLVLYVDTDAPVAPADGHLPSLTEALPLFDRVRFDVVAPGSSGGASCDGCTQEFAVDADRFAQSGVSVGLPLPPGQTGWSVRVRLYVQRFTPLGGDPNADTSLDATFSLPALAATGIVEMTAMLATDSVGQPQASGASLIPGAPAPSQVGTWAGATRTPCSGLAPSGMVCIPGGAFWMGSPASDLPPGTLEGWHRLVVLSPFFLDATEMTVATARAIGVDFTTIATWDGASSGDAINDYCTFSFSAGPRDGVPINCITQQGARELCKRRRADLPTEAQLEYAMGGLRNQPFVWGVDPPGCANTVWGRNGAPLLLAAQPQTCRAPSNDLGAIGGPEPPGHGSWDVLDAGTGTVLDLNGNVSEWARDTYQPLTGSCWSPPGVYTDPTCTAGATVVERGGAWTSGGAGLEAAGRVELLPTKVGFDLGLRCAAAAE